MDPEIYDLYQRLENKQINRKQFESELWSILQERFGYDTGRFQEYLDRNAREIDRAEAGDISGLQSPTVTPDVADMYSDDYDWTGGVPVGESLARMGVPEATPTVPRDTTWDDHTGGAQEAAAADAARFVEKKRVPPKPVPQWSGWSEEGDRAYISPEDRAKAESLARGGRRQSYERGLMGGNAFGSWSPEFQDYAIDKFPQISAEYVLSQAPVAAPGVFGPDNVGNMPFESFRSSGDFSFADAIKNLGLDRFGFTPSAGLSFNPGSGLNLGQEQAGTAWLQRLPFDEATGMLQGLAQETLGPMGARAMYPWISQQRRAHEQASPGGGGEFLRSMLAGSNPFSRWIGG